MIVYLKKERMKKSMGPNYKVNADERHLKLFTNAFGADNVRTRVAGLKR